MKTMTCSMPDDAGCTRPAMKSVSEAGAIERSSHPSAAALAAVAARVRNARRDMGVDMGGLLAITGWGTGFHEVGPRCGCRLGRAVLGEARGGAPTRQHQERRAQHPADQAPSSG